MNNYILEKLLLIPGILAGFAFHEYAHAYVADKLGDKTPRFQGRLTLNPLTHIDPIGFLMIIFFRFGWAKPVQINPSAFKNYYKDDLKVSIAGPIANLIVAFFSVVLYMILFKTIISINAMPSAFTFSLIKIILNILELSAIINCSLFVLNLIPIPGFDGFHILRDLFPKFFYNIADSIYRYQFIIMIVFLASPLASVIIGKPADFLVKLMFSLVKMS